MISFAAWSLLFGHRMKKRVGVGLVIACAVAIAGCSNSHGARAAGAGPTAGSSAAGQAGSSVNAGNGGSASGDAGIAGSANAGAPATPTIPLKDGVPIGDCVDPTPEQLAAKGCPATQPTPSSGCSLDHSVDCRYPIKVEGGGLSSQLILSCDHGTWDPGVTEWCGQSCDVDGVNGDNPIDFAVGSCPERALAECDDGKGTMYAHPPSALTLTTAMLESALEACNALINGNPVTLELQNGCPKRLSSGMQLNAAASKCLTDRLGTARWKCATKLPCASFLQVLATAG